MSECITEYGAMGGAQCAPEYGYDVSGYLMRLVADDGTVNKFDTEAAVTAEEINTRIALANTEPSKAIFPIYQKWDNLADEQGEPENEDLSSGATIFIQDGVRSPVGEIPKAHWEIIDQLNKFKPGEWGIFTITNEFGFKYRTDKTKVQVLPLQIQSNTLHASPIPGVPGTADKVRLTWTYARSYKAASTRVITEDALGFNPLNTAVINELVPTLNVLISASTTQLVFDLKTVFGKPITGKTLTEIAAVENRSTGASVATTAVNEGVPGRYTVDYTTPLAGEFLSPIFLDDGYFTIEANKESIEVA